MRMDIKSTEMRGIVLYLYRRNEFISSMLLRLGSYRYRAAVENTLRVAPLSSCG